MNPPLVSVVVPVYNGERFLDAALESIQAQDYRRIEIIVVNDGSTDRTADIAQAVKGIRYLYQSNQGPAAARNAGMGLARGEFIAFLDADDLLAPNKVDVQVAYLMSHPEVGCAVARQVVFYEPGIEPPRWLSETEAKDEPHVGPAPPNRRRAMQVVRNGLLAAMVRRDIVARLGGFNPVLNSAEDVEWLLHLWEAGVEIVVVPEAILYRRLHGGNLTFNRHSVRTGWLHLVKGRIDRSHPMIAFDTVGVAHGS